MNVFQITKTVRKVGHTYGQPCWLIECGPGTNYPPESLLETLAKKGLQPRDLVVLQNGLAEKGVSKLVKMLSYLPCKTEVEARGHQPMPTWFTLVDHWTVYWEEEPGFNLGALRRGQDMLISKSLNSLVGSFGKDNLVDKGYLSSKPLAPGELEVLFSCRIRLYVEEEKEC